MKNGITQVGNWQAETNKLLNDALRASVEVTGRDGENATRHAIILMAQSARKMTKQAKKNRKIQRTADKRPYLLKTSKGGRKRRWYLPDRKREPEEYAEKLAKWRPIRGRGLAKRSWMWGLKGLKGSPMAKGKPLSGVAYLKKILGSQACGYVLTNSLNYILKIMPPGWQAAVARKAGNRIMKQAARKLESRWKRKMEGPRPAGAGVPAGLEKYFLGG